MCVYVVELWKKVKTRRVLFVHLKFVPSLLLSSASLILKTGYFWREDLILFYEGTRHIENKRYVSEKNEWTARKNAQRLPKCSLFQSYNSLAQDPFDIRAKPSRHSQLCVIFSHVLQYDERRSHFTHSEIFWVHLQKHDNCRAALRLFEHSTLGIVLNNAERY